MTAPGGGSTTTGQRPRQNRLPGPRQATDRDQHWRLRHNEAPGQIEIAFGIMPDRFPVSHLFALREQHMRADRCPHREKQRQGGETVEVLVRRTGKVVIEHRVRRRSIVEMNQIHQREREIVENIRCGDHRIELDGIEQ